MFRLILSNNNNNILPFNLTNLRETKVRYLLNDSRIRAEIDKYMPHVNIARSLYEDKIVNYNSIHWIYPINYSDRNLIEGIKARLPYVVNLNKGKIGYIDPDSYVNGTDMTIDNSIIETRFSIDYNEIKKNFKHVLLMLEHIINSKKYIKSSSLGKYKAINICYYQWVDILKDHNIQHICNVEFDSNLQNDKGRNEIVKEYTKEDKRIDNLNALVNEYLVLNDLEHKYTLNELFFNALILFRERLNLPIFRDKKPYSTIDISNEINNKLQNLNDNKFNKSYIHDMESIEMWYNNDISEVNNEYNVIEFSNILTKPLVISPDMAVDEDDIGIKHNRRMLLMGELNKVLLKGKRLNILNRMLIKKSDKLNRTIEGYEVMKNVNYIKDVKLRSKIISNFMDIKDNILDGLYHNMDFKKLKAKENIKDMIDSEIDMKFGFIADSIMNIIQIHNLTGFINLDMKSFNIREDIINKLKNNIYYKYDILYFMDRPLKFKFNIIEKGKNGKSEERDTIECCINRNYVCITNEKVILFDYNDKDNELYVNSKIYLGEYLEVNI